MPSYRDMTAPQLVGQWKRVVNDNVHMGRDSHLMKELLLRANPTQVLLGMYQFEGNRTVTIPQFYRAHEEWLELDESAADIELAVLITNKTPPDYYTWKELKDEQTAAAYALAFEAHYKLQEWADRILS